MNNVYSLFSGKKSEDKPSKEDLEKLKKRIELLERFEFYCETFFKVSIFTVFIIWLFIGDHPDFGYEDILSLARRAMLGSLAGFIFATVSLNVKKIQSYCKDVKDRTWAKIKSWFE